MNQLVMRIWLLLVFAFVMNACSSNAPEVKPDTTQVYRTITQPQKAPPQYFYSSATHGGTQPLTAPPQNFYKSYRPASHSGPFQIPVELEPAVEFWRKTYTVWHLSEVAFHDDRYLDVIYEVMELPGYVGDSLTSEQKEMINQRRDYWKAQLAGLENKLRYNEPLNANDRQLIAKLENNGRQLNSVLNGGAERVRSQRGIRERFIRGLEISRRYDGQFRKIFRDAGLPEDLAYLPHVESSFQYSAKSSAGAVGMWQFTKAAAQTFMPASHRPVGHRYSRSRTTGHRAAGNRSTSHRVAGNRSTSHRVAGNRTTGHRLAGYRTASHRLASNRTSRHRPAVHRLVSKRVDQRLDPFASTIGAARYLSYAYSKLGNWPAAITSYNHGIYGMIRAQDQVGLDFVRIVETYDGPSFGFASRNYYAQFLAVCEIANNLMQYFPYGVQYDSSIEPSQSLAGDGE